MQTDTAHWHQLPNAPGVGTPLGTLHDLPDGQARMLEWTTDAANAPFRYLLLRSGGTVHAYVNRCAHFGVPLAQKQEHLMFKSHISITCNVHYARYDWQDGHCLGGDCDGEGLLRIPVHVGEDGSITIATA